MGLSWCLRSVVAETIQKDLPFSLGEEFLRHFDTVGHARQPKLAFHSFDVGVEDSQHVGSAHISQHARQLSGGKTMSLKEEAAKIAKVEQLKAMAAKLEIAKSKVNAAPVAFATAAFICTIGVSMT